MLARCNRTEEFPQNWLPFSLPLLARLLVSSVAMTPSQHLAGPHPQCLHRPQPPTLFNPERQISCFAAIVNQLKMNQVFQWNSASVWNGGHLAASSHPLLLKHVTC